MNVNEAMIAWTPIYAEDDRKAGHIMVGPWPDRNNWSADYRYTQGACMMRPEQARILLMFIDFHTCVVRDGIDPQKAHQEFLKIDEYRQSIPEDIPGVDIDE